MSVKRMVAPSVAVAVLLIVSGSVFLKIRADARAEAEQAEQEDGAPLPQVSAGATFNTDIAIPVIGAPVTRGTLVISVTAAAEAAAWRVSRVLAEVGGRIERIGVRENQSVGPGAFLMALDTTDLALQVAEARAGLAQAAASFREITLFDDQIQDSTVREERARVARARSGLDQAEVTLRRRLTDLERARLSAPFAGRVASIKVSPGHRVSPGDELMTVVDIDPIKVEVQVLESEVGYLAEGGAAQVTFAAFSGETFTGRISTINPIVERESRTARVTVSIPNPDGRILPGMYARVSLEARRFADRILVPRSAVLERDRRTMLFVYEGDDAQGFAKWKYVTTGLENDSLVEIVEHPDTDMLEPGQVVLIDGHYTLIHDATVRLTTDLSGVGRRPR